MNEDDVIILNIGDDDDRTIYQTEEERKKLEKELLGNDGDDQDITEVDTTLNMSFGFRPYWREVFG